MDVMGELLHSRYLSLFSLSLSSGKSSQKLSYVTSDILGGVGKKKELLLFCIIELSMGYFALVYFILFNVRIIVT